MRWHCWLAVGLLASACDRNVADGGLRQEWQARADELVERVCAQAESCACELSTASSPCTAVQGDRWRARLVAGRDLDLQWDDACAQTIGDGIDAAGCAWPERGAAHPCHAFCQVLHGERGLGQSCEGLDELVSDCEQGLLCDRGRCVEPCTQLTGLAQGEVCSDPSSGTPLDRCADGLRCDSNSGRCTPTIALGAVCNDSNACGVDAYCAWFERPPLCRPGGVEGSNCELAECASGHDCRWDDALGFPVCRADAGLGESCIERDCGDALWCDGAQCRGPAGAGGSCYDAPCTEDLVCDYATYLCGPPPAIGAPCDAGVCAPGAWCDASSTTTSPSCRAALADAEPCSGHVQCESGYCPAGACRPRPRLGEDCSGTLACAIGLSCDGAICRDSATVGPAVCVYDGW